MAKHKYHFNYETLTFTKIEFNLRMFLKKIATRFFYSLLMGIVLFLTAWYTIDSPAVRDLRNKTQQILYKIDYMNHRIYNSFSILNEIQQRDNEVYRSFFETSPIPASVRMAGFGGTQKYKNYENLIYGKNLTETATRLDIISKQLVVQSKSFDTLIRLLSVKEKMLASIPAIRPIRNKDISGFGAFGMRLHPILKITRMHYGVDLRADCKKPIYATGDGEVSVVSYDAGGLGNYVQIDHGFGYQTFYGHSSKILVETGQKVKRGDIIALVGSSGLSNVCHVHYEVHKNGYAVDPMNFFYDDLTDKDYLKIIEMAEKSDINMSHY